MGRKKALSKTEHKLIVRIPPIVRLRPIVVEPRPILIAFNVEHLRIAVRVELHDVPPLPLPAYLKRGRAVFYTG